MHIFLINRAATLLAHPTSGAKDAELELVLFKLINCPLSYTLGNFVILVLQYYVISYNLMVRRMDSGYSTRIA